MLRVYLDGILQAQEDIINISDSFETSIVREDGFDNTSPILREKTDATMEFKGAAYNYLCSKRRENYCVDIAITINYECDGAVTNIFNGYIQQKEMEYRPDRCTCRANTIRDDSFSAKFRDYINVDISLYNTQTRSCDDLVTVNQYYTFSKDPADIPGSQVSKPGFDVLDTLQYYVNYITDNQINVVSDYLTANRYAIAKGYSLHTVGGRLDQIFPTSSFEKVFNEVRKKLNLYMAIEYDENDTPYLRIEQKSYFFNNDVLLEITGIPVGTSETFDNKTLFNKVEVGSQNTDADTIYYPQNRLYAWQDEVYTGCGSCAGDKDSTLDLVNEFIIDSNMIYEVLNQADGADYTHDDSIYLFAYNIVGTDRIATLTIEPIFGDYIYNYYINNENTLENWGDAGARCVALTRNAGSAFSVVTDGTPLLIPVTSNHNVGLNEYARKGFNGTVLYDVAGGISTLDTQTTPQHSINIPATAGDVDNTKVFTVPSNGSYKFRAASTILMCDYGAAFVDPAIFLQYSIVIAVYTDNTLTTLVDEYSTVVVPARATDGTPEDTDLEIITPDLTLAAGNVVYVYKRIDLSNAGAVINSSADFCETNGVFELVYDSNSCRDNLDTVNDYPFVIEFTYPLCLSDYNKIRENKSGQIRVNNMNYYIREIKFVPQKMSGFKLIGAESMCECTI